MSNDPPVPRDKAEEWMPVRSLVAGAQALARAYEQSLENAEDDSMIDCDDANEMTADGNDVVRRAVRARRCVRVQVEVCVCVRGRSYLMYCRASEVVNLTTEFFFSKTKTKTKTKTKHPL